MADEQSSASPLEAVADAAGERATEAFAILANETRLSIMLALWEASEPFDDDEAVPFEALRERVGVEDASQFGYHLKKLTGRYVRETDDGYALRQAGRHVVQSVVAGTGIEDPSIEPTELDRECEFCGAPTAVTYRDGWLCVVCTECEGGFGGREDTPEGLITGGAFQPAGFTDRSPEEMLDAQSTKQKAAFLAAAEGVCYRCTGPMEGWLDVCDDHDEEGTCAACGRQDQIQARFRCQVCKSVHGLSPGQLASFHPALISFSYEHGDVYLYETAGTEGPDSIDIQLEEAPLRVRVRYEFDGDVLWVTLDEALDIVDIEQSTT